MRYRIARKIVFRMGHGYPIDNVARLEKAVRIHERKSYRIALKNYRKMFKDMYLEDWRPVAYNMSEYYKQTKKSRYKLKKVGTMRKNKYSLFTIAESPSFDINDDKKIMIDTQTYIISFRDYDKTGAQRLWLRLSSN